MPRTKKSAVKPPIWQTGTRPERPTWKEIKKIRIRARSGPAMPEWVPVNLEKVPGKRLGRMPEDYLYASLSPDRRIRNGRVSGLQTAPLERHRPGWQRATGKLPMTEQQKLSKAKTRNQKRRFDRLRAKLAGGVK